MEIFIIGIIIVALMVYASTKMKKFTANAFEPEKVETNEFSLIKPEGFLHVVGGESDVDFYAYSKEFGKENAEDMRQAEIYIKTFTDKTLSEVCDGIKTGAESIVSFSEMINFCLMEVEKKVDETSVSETYKIVENGKIYQLKIKVLKDFKPDYEERVETILGSFDVK